MKLHVFPLSPRAFKVLAVANHLGLDYEQKFVDLAKGEQRLPEFAALNPNMVMPVLEEDDGFGLWESNAITQYLAAKKPASGLMPTDIRKAADVNRWQMWDMANWDPACAMLIFENFVKGALGRGVPDPAEIAKGEEKFHKAAKILDDQLRGRKFITGEALTVADFSIGAPLNLVQPAKIPLEPYAEIKRWHETLCSLPAWQKTLAAQRAAPALRVA
jgi:glutathione S-transferase